MAIYSNLKSLFPVYEMEYFRDSVLITEQSSTAKIKELKWINSCFQNIDTKIVKDLTSFFQGSGAPEVFNWDCDGIIMFEEDGNKYVFLSELKSSFSSQDLYHAKDQLISSYIKVNMILHLLPGYRKQDYVFKAFIAILPAKKSYIRDLHKELLFNRGSRYKTEAEFTDELYNSSGRCLTLKATECDKLKELPLGDNCLFNELEFYLIEVPDESSSICLDVHDYI